MTAIPWKEKLRNERIRENVLEMYKEFVAEVDPKNVFDLLIQKRIISIHQKQEIANKTTVLDRCRALLDHLFFCSNDKSFIVLREALEEHYHWIVERIDQCEPKNETVNIMDANCYQNKMTQTEQQEHPEEPAHVNLPSNEVEMLRNEFESMKLNFEIENTLLVHELDEGTKVVEELKEQNRVLKESLDKAFYREKILKEIREENVEIRNEYFILQENYDKALNREKNLRKELDAIKALPKPEIQETGLSGNVQKAFDATLKGNKPQKNPSASSSESSKLFESKVIVFGIDDGVSITKDIIEINLNRSENAFKPQQNLMPIEMIGGSAAAVHCNSIFVTGVGNDSDEIWRFNTTSSKWKKCASLVQGRQCHSVAFVDHILYICGGWERSKKKTLDDVEAYDTQKDLCLNVGKLAFPVDESGNCVPFKSSLYIFGGYDTKGKMVNRVQVYDTKLNVCTLLSKSMPRAQYLMRAAIWKNTVILLGSTGCLTYNFETEVWKVRDQFKTDAQYFGLTISRGLVFAIGGGDITEDAYGKKKWTCRDDVRCVPVVNILKDEPIEWKQHAKLPKPSLVHAFERMDFG